MESHYPFHPANIAIGRSHERLLVGHVQIAAGDNGTPTSEDFKGNFWEINTKRGGGPIFPIGACLEPWMEEWRYKEGSSITYKAQGEVTKHDRVPTIKSPLRLGQKLHNSLYLS
jgi:hypothetical protein